MAGFLDTFRTRVTSSLRENVSHKPDNSYIDYKIALGVLLQMVADADDKFLSEEQGQIESILTQNSAVDRQDIPVILESIKQAKEESIDLYRFTSEVKKNISYEKKTLIVRFLFKVACIDKELDNKELEIIRKISDLVGISHSDFIKTKIEIKKEYGLKTVDY